MKENSFIYLRGLKHAAFTVFCVEDGQKSYYDPQFNVRVPFSSGQQVKRSILEQLNDVLGVQPSPTEFYFDVDKKGALKEGEVLSSCDPHYVDQLLGGWMRTPKGGKANLHKWLCNLKRFSYFCVVSDRRLCLSGNFQFINILAVVVDDKDGCRGRRLFLSDTKAGNKNNAYEVSYLCGVLQERGRL